MIKVTLLPNQVLIMGASKFKYENKNIIKIKINNLN